MEREVKKSDGADIDGRIRIVRGHRVILDVDLAAIYGVPTKRLNEQVRRNVARFPDDFAFQLSIQEVSNLKSQIATSSLKGNSSHGGARKMPWVFTEHGAIMAANVLNSTQAVKMGVYVVRAFVRLREAMSFQRDLAIKLDELERKVGAHDEHLRVVFDTLRRLTAEPEKPKRRIGFTAQEKNAYYKIG
jgi:hypothetical protein